MRWSVVVSRLLRGMAFIALLGAGSAQAQDAKPYTKEQLDQMTAQVALYPDSLLSQLFMATTYPDEFAAATQWAKAHPDAKGDDAVKMVESQDWDPSVASMVAFPEVLITLGEKTDWVKNMGDAFLAQPEDVMDSVQRLRVQAQKAGNLKSSEQVKVSTQAVPPPETATAPAVAAAPAPQVIVIEQAQPQVVYVPMYNPTTVYGPWLWPAYPPYYYPYPPGYWWSRPIATGIAWGVGIGVSNALWGGFNWGRGDVDINVNRYNNINVNNKLDTKGGDKTWNHNPEHRKASYRGGEGTRQNLDKKYQSGNREQFRGHDANRDANRDASRERANQAMANRGVEAPQGSAADRAKAMERDGARDRPGAGGGGGGFDVSRDRAGNGGGGGFDVSRDKLQSADRSAAKMNAQSANRDNALRGANSSQARQQADRGAMSHASANRSGGGGGQARPSAGGGGHAKPSGGGGGQRPSGGGGGGGGRKR